MPITEGWLQAGSFGLLALIIVAVIWKGIPYLVDKLEKTVATLTASHDRTIASLTKTFEETLKEIAADYKEESTQCRTERLAQAAQNATERERDRLARHAMWSQVVEMVSRGQLGKLDLNAMDPNPEDSSAHKVVVP